MSVPAHLWLAHFPVALLLVGAAADAAGAALRDPRVRRFAAGAWALAAAGVLRALWRGRLDGARGWIALAAALGSAALVVAIAASGMAISHG